ncbi:DNA repair protein RecO [Kineosporia sp. NBRC 101731]|uniref:DNA repair protein RecO n=1 Tax=Kineosporia sp. NBRC 101731 TaxID=3032199 RepID=UPI0024A0BBAF|nr:DNA repair protein RecO [Kineosporia sp. NBRC 101731]GLY32962.1 DNA repair protein RecO [Kineosporia sp. NBRC 101731]
MPAVYRDDAIVLRAQKLGEADRIVTLLTREHGRVRAVAKGVRKTMSRFGARLEPFMMIDVQLYEGRSLDTVNQVETIGAYGLTIAADYARYTAATAMLETAERLTETEREPALQQFLLLAGGLRTLAGKAHEPGLVLDAYLIRSLSVAGWAPSFTDCARCGQAGPHRAFSLAMGGSVCPSCRPPGAAAPHPETLRLLSALLTGDWPTADVSEARRRREASGLVAAYLQWHVERRVRSLRWVERDGDRPSINVPVNVPVKVPVRVAKIDVAAIERAQAAVAPTLDDPEPF